ncbi:complement factor H-like [Astyanax mexicanus]|uniref:Complement factor H-like n=1 Tax=Astyanax mexicanus TaxID=7994 RepID=A0A8T2M7Y9_ASTMX|nr:complement factor H-like [Astyanax mexicanus]
MFRIVRSAWTLVLCLLAFVSTGEAADECSKPTLTDKMVLTDDSSLKNDFPDGSKVTIECAYGFEADHGSDTITCTGGTWSDVELVCKKKDCGSPPTSPNLMYNMANGTLLGALIQPVCDEGYYLQGSSYRQCLPFGWSGNVECLLITCDKPTEILNGMITKRPDSELPKMDDVIEYTCNPGFKLIGKQSILCQDDSEYNSVPPVCTPIECQVPHVQFGVLKEKKSNYTHKSEAVFQCQSGYIMEGSPRIVCEEHGWSTLPVCIKESYRTTKKVTATTASTSTSTGSSSTTLGLIEMMPGPPPNSPDSPDLGYTLAVLGCIFFALVVCFCIVAIVRHHVKRKGSYDTGEALKTKEELLLKTPSNLTPI